MYTGGRDDEPLMATSTDDGHTTTRPSPAATSPRITATPAAITAASSLPSLLRQPCMFAAVPSAVNGCT